MAELAKVLAVVVMCALVLWLLGQLAPQPKAALPVSSAASDKLVELTQRAVDQSVVTLRSAATWRLAAIVFAGAVPLGIGLALIRCVARQRPNAEDLVEQMVKLDADARLLFPRPRSAGAQGRPLPELPSRKLPHRPRG